MKFSLKLPIAAKIYGLATTILLILLGIAFSNYQQMWRVNQEVITLAEYTAPLKKHIASINIHALEQEVHFERILRLYEIKPLDTAQLAQEQQSFARFGNLVTQELDQAINLAEQAINMTVTTEALVEFALLKPLFQVIEEDHKGFNEQVIRIIDLLQAEEKEEAQFLDIELERQEDLFNQRIYSILLNLDEFAATTATVIEKHEQNLLRLNLWLTTIGSISGLALAAILTTRLVKPVRTLVQAAKAVESGDLDAQVKVQSGDEIETLALAFNSMLQDVRQKEVLKEAFGQYVDPRIVENLIDQHIDARGRKEITTVFFSDLAGFSTISEMLTPARLVTLINHYLTLATEPITESRGVIDKFIGDAIVAFWGPPFVSETEHAQLACYAALEQLPQLTKLQRLLPDIVGIRKGIPKLKVRVGLDTGELIIGNIGTEHQQNYTILGRTLEIAEELESANKRYGTEILLTERTRQLAGESIAVRKIDYLPIGDQNAPLPIYELLAYGIELDESIAELRDSFEQGLDAYHHQDWLRAQALFESCLKIDAKDGPSKYYLEQIARIVQ